jgi:putative ABC transport system ATP-binding protein
MLLKSNRELHQTTLMITHNPEAAAIAGRILYMRDGEIVREEIGQRPDPALSGSLPASGPTPPAGHSASAAV